MSSPLAIGLVEDNPGDARLIQEMLREPPVTPLQVDWSSRLDEVLARLERRSFDVLLLDLGLPDSQGLATFYSVHGRAPKMPIIIFSGAVDEELAVEAVAHGAQDYLVKGQIDGFLLKRAIRYAIERKRAESEIQELNDALERRVAERTAQLEEANKELESFSYSVSHDLRAPLRHVTGFSDLLSAHAGPNLDDQARRYLATITAAASRMGRLIDDLLAFSRMGRATVSKRPVSLADIVRDAQTEVAAGMSGREIVWTVHPLPQVEGDPALLRQAVVNLLSNAAKYTSNRSQPQIEVGTLEQANSDVVLFVRDNGVGFDMRYAHKLFEVFQRLHRADEFDGTGIGLANVRRIINRHGGRTWAEGEVGRGATFYFSLPGKGPAT